MWSKRWVCVGEQGWRDGEVEKETEVFSCVCVWSERHGVGLCGCECVLEILEIVCVCVCLERLGSMGIQRQVFVCIWRDGRCVERGGFVGVFVCGETGSEWREKQGCLCVYVERMGCGYGELRYVEQAMGVCWGAGVEKWGGRERD